MRINKYLSAHGICSRREADRLIEAGGVRINDRVAVLGDTVSDDDDVFVDGAHVARKGRVYIAFNKPLGVEVTLNEELPRSIKHLLPADEHLFPIGRLDKQTTGLLLITNDGDLAQAVMRPEGGHEKEYLVHTDQPITNTALKMLSTGVKIGGYRTKPTAVLRHNKRAFRMTLTEGKNRQIRRMLESLSLKVTSLRRIRVVNIKLGKLKEGDWRPLSKAELKTLKRALGLAG